jgi:benzoyl-CoA 2,3-dioxygenase component A
MRAMTERRRRRMGRKEGGELWLFFGARTPGELPYCGPLLKLPQELISVNLAFSRQPDQPKQYVQDLIRARGGELARLLKDENSYIYICGLKAMEAGVNEAFAEVCQSHGMDWASVLMQLKAASRYHVETY